MAKDITSIIDEYKEKYEWFVPNDWTATDIAINFAAELDNPDIDIESIVDKMPKWLKNEAAYYAIQFALSRSFEEQKEIIKRLNRIALIFLS